ncbi:MAG: ferrous iron transport protein A [Planctomycetota bacterium]|jgi:Fe2+ transport system protein FeoA|nr:MAG: ferrous iron transport protein A [Planctomycetota bacterium]RLS92645.1 MAG: ferrous iron transport protein A [Planctomycetota bacterium]
MTPRPNLPQQPLRLPLTQLKRGDRARVEWDAAATRAGAISDNQLSDQDREVLRAMGLDELCEFTVCRAGAGGPCIIQVDAMRLGLSPDLARRIMTRPCNCPSTERCAAESSTAVPSTTSTPSPQPPLA